MTHDIAIFKTQHKIEKDMKTRMKKNQKNKNNLLYT